MRLHPRAILHLVGALLVVTGGALVLPVIASLMYGAEGDLFALTATMGGSLALGVPLYVGLRNHRDTLSTRDAVLIATLGWVVVSAVSAVPFVLHGSIPSFTDAFFEMMSGYTTTGSTILTDIEVVPHGLLLWRSETHLIGGMGFLTLAVLLLPHGVSGLRIFRAESSPGQVVTRERFTARNRDAVVWLWSIYLVLNAALVVLLLAGGMSLFDSLCHAFGTVSTSGYSSYNTSIGHYDSAYFDWVITLFMFLGGTTFMLFYYLAHGNWRVLRSNTEFRWYLGLVLFFSVAVAAILWGQGGLDAADAARHGAFQVVSLITTTGFTTADYETWPHGAQMLLLVAMFIGASAGSTTSGIKVVHYVLIWRFIVATLRRSYLQPLAVVSVRLNGRRVDASVVHLALIYFVVNVFMVIGGGVFMSIVDGMDIQTAITSVIATLMNIGPGFGQVGPSHSFALVSPVGKWFLSFNMLVGRLEMFSALVLFYPSFWTR